MQRAILANSDVLDPELEVLQDIYAQGDHVRQRDLARIAGLSLGMTNAIVKRLVQKGWLTIKKVNNRNIRYAVSAAGIDEITRRSYRFFKRTIKNIVYYRDAIEKFVHEVKGQGYKEIVLIGASDLGFIIEHACVKYGVGYAKSDDAFEKAREASGEGRYFMLYSEGYIPDDEEKRRAPNVAFLQYVVRMPGIPMRSVTEANSAGRFVKNVIL